MGIHAKKLIGAYLQLGDIPLARGGAELKGAFGRTLSNEEYLQQLSRLERRLLAFYILSDAYQPTEDLSDALESAASAKRCISLSCSNDPKIGNICFGKRWRM